MSRPSEEHTRAEPNAHSAEMVAMTMMSVSRENDAVTQEMTDIPKEMEQSKSNDVVIKFCSDH